MNVFGYNAAQEVIEVDLPIEQIAAHGIDPVAVDLCDDTTVLNVDGQQLIFSQLNDISFAYIQGDILYVGSVANGERVCVCGPLLDLNDHSQWEMAVSKLRVVDFRTHYHRFLRRRMAEARRTSVLGKSDCVTLDKERLIFDSESGDAVPHYCGEMFFSVQLEHELPEAVNLILERFSDWKPLVFGSAVRDIFLDRAPTLINFFAKPVLSVGDNQAALKRLSRAGAKNISCPEDIPETDLDLTADEYIVWRFRIGAVEYNLWELDEQDDPLDLLWQRADFSIEQFCARRPDQVIASHIALHDFGAGSFRLISGIAEHLQSLRDGIAARAELFRNQGLNKLEPRCLGDFTDPTC